MTYVQETVLMVFAGAALGYPPFMWWLAVKAQPHREAMAVLGDRLLASPYERSYLCDRGRQPRVLPDRLSGGARGFVGVRCGGRVFLGAPPDEKTGAGDSRASDYPG